MDNQVKKLSAASDPYMQEVLRRSLGDLAGQFARRTTNLADAIEAGRQETPLLVTTLNTSLEPTKTPGMLWHVVSRGQIYYYNTDMDEFMSVSPEIREGNNHVASLGGGSYTLSLLAIPDNVYLENVRVYFFASASLTATVYAYTFGGSSLASNTLSAPVAGTSSVSINFGTNIDTGFGMEVRATIVSGGTIDTSVVATFRRRP